MAKYTPLNLEVSDFLLIFAAGFNAYDPDKATMFFGLSIPNLSTYQVTIMNPKDASSAKTRSLESEMKSILKHNQSFQFEP